MGFNSGFKGLKAEDSHVSNRFYRVSAVRVDFVPPHKNCHWKYSKVMEECLPSSRWGWRRSTRHSPWPYPSYIPLLTSQAKRIRQFTLLAFSKDYRRVSLAAVQCAEQAGVWREMEESAQASESEWRSGRLEGLCNVFLRPQCRTRNKCRYELFDLDVSALE